MDETVDKGFPIPPKAPLFGEGDLSVKVAEVPESDFVMAFGNDAGDKAVVLTAIEVIGPDTIERHGRAELEEYAKTLMETGDDPFDLQIGRTYEGENAIEDARAEALRLDEEFNPGEDAEDKVLVIAVDDMRGGAEGLVEEPAEEPMDAPELEKPLGKVEGPVAGAVAKGVKFGAKVQKAADELEEAEEEEPGEDEAPILEQLKKAKK